MTRMMIPGMMMIPGIIIMMRNHLCLMACIQRSLGICFSANHLMEYIFESDENADGAALFIIRKWRAQTQHDEIQKSVFNAEAHFQAMCEAGGTPNTSAGKSSASIS